MIPTDRFGRGLSCVTLEKVDVRLF
jgi:hypothetical protein